MNPEIIFNRQVSGTVPDAEEGTTHTDDNVSNAYCLRKNRGGGNIRNNTHQPTKGDRVPVEHLTTRRDDLTINNYNRK